MAVTVSSSALRREWNPEAPGILLAFTPTGPKRALSDAAVAVEAAVSEANAAAEHNWLHYGATAVAGGLLFTGDKSVVITVTEAESWKALSGWSATIADSLTAAGLTGRLAPARIDIPAYPGDGEHLTAVLCVGGWRPDRDNPLVFARERSVSGWLENEHALHRITTQLIDWVADGLPTVYVGRPGAPFLMPVDAARAVVGSSPHDVDLQTGLVAAGMRRVRLRRTGHILWTAQQEGSDWATTLQVLRDVIVSWAELCDYSFVRRAGLGVGWMIDIVNHLPPRVPPVPMAEEPYNYYMYQRELDAERVPDAMGLQVLTEAHLAHATDLSRWDVTEVAAGRYLVSARDLAAWFAGDIPDDAALRDARADFGSMALIRKPNP